MVCPADIVTTNDVGQCGAVVSYIAPVATRRSSDLNTVQSGGLASGQLFPVGVTTNSFVVSDAAGNTAACSFTVTVSDAQPPVIVCPADIVTTNDVGQCGAIVSYSGPVGTDTFAGAN